MTGREVALGVVFACVAWGLWAFAVAILKAATQPSRSGILKHAEAENLGFAHARFVMNTAHRKRTAIVAGTYALCTVAGVVASAWGLQTFFGLRDGSWGVALIVAPLLNGLSALIVFGGWPTMLAALPALLLVLGAVLFVRLGAWWALGLVALCSLGMNVFTYILVEAVQGV